MISACENGKQPGKVREFLVAMQQDGLEPVMNTFSAAIDACEKDKRPEVTLEPP